MIGNTQDTVTLTVCIKARGVYKYLTFDFWGVECFKLEVKIDTVSFTGINLIDLFANIIERKRFWWDELENLLIANNFHGQPEVEIDYQLHNWPLVTQHS